LKDGVGLEVVFGSTFSIQRVGIGGLGCSRWMFGL
jgi:hypothetical protein